jgi:hypothetical protein
MKMNNEKNITDEYHEFVSLAEILASQDLVKYPLQKKEDPRERFSRHLLGMLEMYTIRYGDADERLRIVTFLESQLFTTLPKNEEASHLTYDMWQDLKNTIISGEYTISGKSVKEVNK